MVKVVEYTSAVSLSNMPLDSNSEFVSCNWLMLLELVSFVEEREKKFEGGVLDNTDTLADPYVLYDDRIHTCTQN